MMSTKIKATFASIAVAALLFPAVAAAAGEGKKFSRADFERCNRQAMQIAGVEADSPAASPGAAQPGQSGTQQERAPGAGAGTTGSGVGAGTSTGAGAGTGAGSGSGTGMGTGAGTTGSVGAAGSGQQELDRVVDAYRSCLQQAQSN